MEATAAATETTHFFRHTALEHKWQLRVVEVVPSQDGQVRCKMHTTPGADARELDPTYDASGEESKRISYIALSYAWGDVGDGVHQILVDGKPFVVRDNLFRFLKHVAGKTNNVPRVFWIDAVCIDQASVAERSEQVLRMTSIYRHAQMVLVWLGPEADDSGLAIQHLERLGTKYFFSQSLVEDDSLSESRRMLACLGPAPFGPVPSLNERTWRAIGKLLSRAWWTRVWVVQEATLAERETWLLCGDTVISRFCLVMGTVPLLAFPKPPPAQLGGSLIARSLDQIQLGTMVWDFQSKRTYGGRHLRLLQLLPSFRKFQATDDLDRVYALLGMADTAAVPYPVDYSKSILGVYTDVVVYLTETSDYAHKLDILGHADDYDDHQSRLSAKAMAELMNAMLLVALHGFKQSTPGSESRRAFFSHLKTRAASLMKENLEHLEHDEDIHPDTGAVLEKVVELLPAAPDDADDVGFDASTSLEDQVEAFASARRIAEDGRGLLSSTARDSAATRAATAHARRLLRSASAVLRETSTKRSADTARSSADAKPAASAPTPEKTDGSAVDAWPSWVPDWRHPQTRAHAFPKEFVRSWGDEPVYTASGTAPEFFTASDEPLVAFCGPELRLRGFRVDTITALTPLRTTAHAEKWQELKRLTPTDLGEFYAPTGERVVDAWRRTATTDLVVDGAEATRRRGRGGAAAAAADLLTDNPFIPCLGRQQALTAGGRLALVSAATRLGDAVFVLGGGQVPYVLRPLQEGAGGHTYCFKGECYVHGLMDGEALDLVRGGRATVETVRIR